MWAADLVLAHVTAHFRHTLSPVITEIRPTRGLADLDLPEAWRRRELWYFLAWRDIKVRYKQTFFGAAWAVLQPVSLAVVFSIFLGRLVNVPSEGVPYPAFVLTGLVPWTLFASALSSSARSLVQSREIISRVYFPRVLLPLSAATSHLLDFVIAAVVVVVALLIYGIPPGLAVLLAPIIGLQAFIVSVAFGTLLAAVNARYRDVEYAVPLLVQVWLFVTPVAYPASLVPSNWQWLYGLNPMAWVVEAYRWSMLGTPAPDGALLVSSLIGTGLFAWAAAIYFQRTESILADVV